MKVINLFGGPGVGKSTTAAGLFFKIKLLGYNVELVNEYAKEKVWQDDHYTLDNQFYILAKQENKLRRLRNKVDFVVTDCPLILSSFYLKLGAIDYYTVLQATDELYKMYDNYNYFLIRAKEYNPIGRLQTEDEAKQCCEDLRDFLRELWVGYEDIVGDCEAPDKIIKHLGL